ncbi:MAG: glycosyl hydrolase [Bacteroidetes bacterium]|nr:glycosyl hydrolase [Bacteroidota bacterium]MBU1483433.1 glycosyl hydrolase [Bacteroidota bacterium]MBU2267322.1 glycosyl hydrolase [Bacteroidota bacterium]MBU2376650.1 glycosyl hydrolase [Bacteroidota bacterium]
MKKFSLLLLLLSLSTAIFAQKKSKSTINSSLKYEYDSVLYTNLKYREIGPFRGGRSAAVVGDLKEKNTFYMGATGGGVWKTQDGGSNWKNISDKYFGGTIGAVAIAPSDNSIIYVGEGENSLRGNVSEGIDGIWKSEDGGRSWANIGLKNTRHITRIIIDPKNSDIVWVAASGHLFGPSDDRGVYKTTDGGKIWKKVLFSNNQAGAIDLVMEPGNPKVFFATTWQVIRTPYSMESGGIGSGLWKSEDGGENWKNISKSKGLPKDTLGILGVAISPSNPDRVYTIIESKEGGLFRSDDAGKTFTKVNSQNEIRQRAWYYSKVFVDPKDENTVYVLNVNFLRSRNGGKTFETIRTPHGDHHDLWIDPEDPNRMIIGDDGGAQVSFDGGENWSSVQNQPTAQFYRVSTDNHFPYRILGAQQDNSTVRILSRTNSGSITTDDWMPTAGAESGYVVADPLNPDIVYGGNYGGYLSRLDHKTGENRAISVWPDNPMGSGADVLKYRFQWNFPILFSPHNSKVLYTAGNVLFKTINEGQSWEAISPDLTRDDKKRQGPSGGIITKDNTSVEYYSTIFTVQESPLEENLIWTGSDDGLLYLTKDGGKNWQNVTPKGMPEWMMFNSIDSDPFQKGTAYVVGTKYKSDDFTPYIYKTADYGQSWKLITDGIPSNHFVRVVRADQKRPGLLYAGTEYGMYISYNDGESWKPFQLNLPIVPITDLTIKGNDLIVATQGRAFWVLDDLSQIQQLKSGIAKANLFVFKPGDSYRTDGYQSAKVKNAGMNPPNGVVINYFLKTVTDSAQVSIKIYDSNKQLIRDYSTKGKADEKIEVNSGMNQFVWNLSYPAVEKIEGMILWNGNVSGPKVPPGNYYAMVKTKADSSMVAFTVKPDPNYNLSSADYQEQFDFLMMVKKKFEATQNAIIDIRKIRSQIETFTSRGKDLPKVVKDKAQAIVKQITTIEETLNQTKAKSGQDVLNFPIRLNDKLSGVYDVAASGYTKPSKQVKEVYNDLAGQIDMELAKLAEIKSKDIKALNDLIISNAVPVITVK